MGNKRLVRSPVAMTISSGRGWPGCWCWSRKPFDGRARSVADVQPFGQIRHPTLTYAGPPNSVSSHRSWSACPCDHLASV